MSRLEALRNDAAVLRQMLRGMPRSSSHAQNLQNFYGAQAQDYDRFRERLLRGREELITRLLTKLPSQARIVELGGGTGRNLDFFGDRLDDIAQFDLVDLCPALLERARERIAHHPQMRMIEADATKYTPSAPVDATWMRPGMNASFEKPAATNVCHFMSMPRFSSSFSVIMMLPISSWPDHTTIQPALSGHQPLLCSHAFDFGEIWS